MEGYRVVATQHGGEALEHLAGGTRPCLILLDLMMPVMDGFDFLDIFRANQGYASVPLCVLSAVVDKSKLPEGLHHVAKPVEVDGFLDLVSSYCGSPPP